MLYTYSTEELIGLQDLIIERIKSNEKINPYLWQTHS